MPLEAVMLKISDGTDDFALLAIPFFVLAGAIMAEGGMAVRLVNLAKIFVGVHPRRPGAGQRARLAPSSAASPARRSPTPRRSAR